MAEEIFIELTLSQLYEWLICSENLMNNAPTEHHPLIDIVQDSSGHRIKIFIDNQR